MSSTGGVPKTSDDTSGTELDWDEEPLWGLKTTLHGVVYQLKLLMLFMIRGLKEKYDFNLWTEKKFARKFDDLVFWYREKENDTNAGKGQYRFLQAKHSQDKKTKIKAADLTSNSGDFSLREYFISWRDIRNHPDLKGYELGDYTICANYPFKEEDLKKEGFSLVESTKTDSILNFEVLGLAEKRPMRYHLKCNDKLVDFMKSTTEIHQLARKLVDMFLGEKPPKIIDRKIPLLKRYRTALIEEQVIDVGSKFFVFTEKFKEDPDTVDREGFQNGRERLRNIFCAEFFKKMNKETPGSANKKLMWKTINESKLKVAKTFSQLEIDNPKLHKKFAEKFSSLIERGENDITITREDKIIADNIDKLVGHVLVRAENWGTYKLCMKFVNADDRELKRLKIFQLRRLRDILEGKGLQLDQFRFKVDGFVLPDVAIKEEDVKDFFEHLVFAVDQPNEVQLGKIIQSELLKVQLGKTTESELHKIDNQFSKQNAHLGYCYLLNKMLDWFKKKGGRSLTPEAAESFIKDFHEELEKASNRQSDEGSTITDNVPPS